MRRALLAVVLTVVVLSTAGAAFGQPNPDGWVIGVHDGAVAPHLGALEYISVDQATFFAGCDPADPDCPSPAEQLLNGWRYPVFDYTVSGPSDDSPDMPGYIGPQNVCVFNTSGDRPCAISTATLNIHFNLLCDYQSGELDFLLSRYGSETDDIFLDGVPLGAPDAEVEAGHVDLVFDLPAGFPGGVLLAGPHILTVAYIGGGTDNGHYVDELQLLPNRDSCLRDSGRMTGGGSVLQEPGARITHGFELHCDPAEGPNNLEVNWRGRGWRGSDGFHLEVLESAQCVDSILDEAPPNAGFDTYIGSGQGRYNGVSGYTAHWRFTDAGQPGTGDSAAIVITAPDGTVVLDVSGNLQQGNHQAH